MENLSRHLEAVLGLAGDQPAILLEAAAILGASFEGMDLGRALPQ
jgi:hypothetical protein